MSSYDIGDSALLTVQFTDMDGAPGDPVLVTFQLRSPSGVVTSTTLEQGSPSTEGEYSVMVTLTEAGDWQWKFTGSGGGIAAATEGVISVRRSMFR